MALNFSKVAIVTHTYTLRSLVEEELLEYLKDKSTKIIFVAHAFKQARDSYPLKTQTSIYKDGKLKKTFFGFKSFGPESFFFIKDLIFNLFYFFFKKEKIDIFFGINNLNAFSGIILKKLGKVNTVVYYVIDYIPQRFSNRILNKIYHWVDCFCVKNANITWNLSDEMAKERIRDGLSKEYLVKQITVPVGCHPIKSSSNDNYKKKRLVFLGNLTRDQGVNLLIDNMPLLIKKIPDIKLVIIGSGEEVENLENRVRELKVEKFVDFKGFVKNNDEVNEILAGCTIGVAPYILSKNSFKYYTDPGKIKTYLGAGLPIIMSNISDIAKVIIDEEAGLLVEDNKEDIIDAVIKIFSNEKYYYMMCNNAVRLSKKYSWRNIFDSAFQATLAYKIV